MGKANNGGNSREIATLGGGCFWCLEAVYNRLEGVESVVSGYAGGTRYGIRSDTDGLLVAGQPGPDNTGDDNQPEGEEGAGVLRYDQQKSQLHHWEEDKQEN